MLILANGEERAGVDLRAIITEAIAVRAALDGLHTRYPQFVVEQAAIAGALNPEVLSDPTQAEDRRRLHRAPPRSSSPRRPSGVGMASRRRTVA